ncbi:MULTISPECIES: flagellar hook-basal body complex protein FliE [Pseudovibrio]|uniref:flagellar hook-basal body complex protein FliE n=1 Tax=Stappiaceae TaxID=2821832 RepID=UPI0023656866|nr:MULTISPECIES: flagellar hook-basal body complex protein FliE [Pseudovibrio]MDD7910449.1 flagellar hook-basal body complex protein FliE [Pseudovibrio exalbescens]MDX5594164.1 flagellar hook-basal body complex protein FliE [Pseudovibrio sp. SPO723]
MANPTLAANAYANMAKLTQSGGNPQEVAGGASSQDFSQLVKTAVEEVRETGQVTETQSLNLLEGKANVVDVVTAVAETELALETMVSVRDRVISAYESIMRMPI